MAYPGKRPLLQMTARPPQRETLFSVFDEADGEAIAAYLSAQC